MNQSEVTKSSPPFRGLCEYDVKKLFQDINTPAYVIDEVMLHKNGKILREIQERTGCKILLAQKAFSNYDVYGILGKYLAGTEASGLYEARLGAEEMPEGEVHVFCGAYREDEFLELLNYADHIVFNSPAQLKKFGGQAKQAGKSVGIRINPEHSTLCQRKPSWNNQGTMGKIYDSGINLTFGWNTFSYLVRAGFRCLRGNIDSGGREVWDLSKTNEMDKFWRRTSYYKTRLWNRKTGTMY